MNCPENDFHPLIQNIVALNNAARIGAVSHPDDDEKLMWLMTGCPNAKIMHVEKNVHPETLIHKVSPVHLRYASGEVFSPYLLSPDDVELAEDTLRGWGRMGSLGVSVTNVCQNPTDFHWEKPQEPHIMVKNRPEPPSKKQLDSYRVNMLLRISELMPNAENGASFAHVVTASDETWQEGLGEKAAAIGELRSRWRKIIPSAEKPSFTVVRSEKII